MAHWKQAQQYAKSTKHPLNNLSQNLYESAGVLLLDGTFVRVKGKSVCIYIAYDTNIGVINYWIDDTENKTAYSYLLREILRRNYHIKCIVSDGHWSLLPIIEEEKYPHQRCIFHILKNLKLQLSTYGEIRGSDKILYTRLKYLLKSPSIEDLELRVRFFKKYYLPFVDLTSKQSKIIKDFLAILPHAIMYLSFTGNEKVPHTTNVLENLNGQIKARLKTFRGVKSEKSLNNLLRILFHFRKYK